MPPSSKFNPVGLDIYLIVHANFKEKVVTPDQFEEIDKTIP
jgi:hypothetical protein